MGEEVDLQEEVRQARRKIAIPEVAFGSSSGIDTLSISNTLVPANAPERMH